MSTIFKPVLNEELIINYNDIHRIVIPIKYLHDGFLATENGLYKNFKYAKLKDVADDKANEIICNENLQCHSTDENLYTTPKKRKNISVPNAPRKKKFERTLTF